MKAANFTYSYVKEKFGAIPEKFSFVTKIHNEVNSNSIIAQGNQTSPLGKIVAGCRFQTYYPITPATDDSEYLNQTRS